MLATRPALLAILLLLTATLSQAAPYNETTYYFVTSGQTGKQTQLDVMHSSVWSFSPTVDFWFGGGLLTMKDGPATNAAITLTLWQGPRNTGINLGSVTLNNPSFTQSFEVVEFSPVAYTPPAARFLLLTGTTYTIALTSPAPDTASRQYFIKTDFYGFKDYGGTDLPVPPTITYDGPPAQSETFVPEPSAWTLLACGMAVLSLARFQQRQPSGIQK